MIHRVQLIFNIMTLEQRHGVGILLHALGMARHQQLHEILGLFIAVGTLDDHFIDIAIIDIADGALHKIAVGVD